MHAPTTLFFLLCQFSIATLLCCSVVLQYQYRHIISCLFPSEVTANYKTLSYMITLLIQVYMLHGDDLMRYL